MVPVAEQLKITDFHTHAFPDGLAERAIKSLCEGNEHVAFHDGTVSGLLASMAEAGIARSVICSIATRPEQFDNILNWSLSIDQQNLVPLGSVHPAADDPAGQMERLKEAGLCGIKVHPYYQDFVYDSDRMAAVWRAAERLGLLVVSHTGFDAAYPERDRRCDPEHILRVVDRFPELKLVTTHLGSWDDWDMVEKYLIGKPIYIEVSFGVQMVEQQRLKEMLLAHPQDYLLFGTDSPWTDQSESVQLLRGLQLPAERERALLEGNAERLLQSVAVG